MSANTYQARFAVGQFAGYCLWAVTLKPPGARRWKDGFIFAGRTDTRLQALGMCACSLAGTGISPESVLEYSETWPEIRARIKTAGNTRKFSEGLETWQAWEGDKAALAMEGACFLEAWQAETKRRLDAKHEGIRQSPEFAKFAHETGSVDLLEFLRWKFPLKETNCTDPRCTELCETDCEYTHDCGYLAKLTEAERSLAS